MSRRPNNPALPREIGGQLLLRCVQCDKSIEGFYARYSDRGVCSGMCMREQDKLPKYPGFTEEDFFNRNPEVKRATRNPRQAAPATAG